MKRRTIKAYGKVEVQLQFFHLGSKVDRSVSFTPQPLYPRVNSPQHSIDMKVGWIQRQSIRLGEEGNHSSLPSIEP